MVFTLEAFEDFDCFEFVPTVERRCYYQALAIGFIEFAARENSDCVAVDPNTLPFGILKLRTMTLAPRLLCGSTNLLRLRSRKKSNGTITNSGTTSGAAHGWTRQ